MFEFEHPSVLLFLNDFVVELAPIRTKLFLNRFNALHDIDLFSPTRTLSLNANIYSCHISLTSQLAEGRISVKQNAIVPGPGHYCFKVPAWLSNDFLKDLSCESLMPKSSRKRSIKFLQYILL